MSEWTPTMEQRREYGLTPFLTLDGRMVADELVFAGHCSGCGQELTNRIGINRSAVALLYPGGTVRAVTQSYDEHPCAAQPYRLRRPYDPRSDMAHPITDAQFVPDSADGIWTAILR